MGKVTKKVAAKILRTTPKRLVSVEGGWTVEGGGPKIYNGAQAIPADDPAAVLGPQYAQPLGALAAFASADKTRCSLNTIQVIDEWGYATDGHTACRVSLLGVPDFRTVAVDLSAMYARGCTGALRLQVCAADGVALGIRVIGPARAMLDVPGADAPQNLARFFEREPSYLVIETSGEALLSLAQTAPGDAVWITREGLRVGPTAEGWTSTAPVKFDALAWPPEREIAIDPQYLARALEWCGGGEVRLAQGPHPHDPVYVRPADGNDTYVALVMPLRQ